MGGRRGKLMACISCVVACVGLNSWCVSHGSYLVGSNSWVVACGVELMVWNSCVEGHGIHFYRVVWIGRLLDSAHDLSYPSRLPVSALPMPTSGFSPHELSYRSRLPISANGLGSPPRPVNHSSSESTTLPPRLNISRQNSERATPRCKFLGIILSHLVFPGKCVHTLSLFTTAISSTSLHRHDTQGAISHMCLLTRWSVRRYTTTLLDYSALPQKKHATYRVFSLHVLHPPTSFPNPSPPLHLPTRHLHISPHRSAPVRDLPSRPASSRDHRHRSRVRRSGAACGRC